jgi:multidrug resistance efflux pump
MSEIESSSPDITVDKTDPVRRWTLIVIILIAILLAWYLRSDRVTPYSSQARVHAIVVPIAAEVSGTVEFVSVGNSQGVIAGQLLFQIEKDRYELAVENAMANLETARQGVGASAAAVDAARAGVSTVTANMLRAEQDAIRMRNIRKQDPGAISQRRLESSEAAYAASQGQVGSAKANLEQAIQNMGAVGDNNSHIQQANSALEQSKLNLQYTTIIAPETGVVTDVRIDTGNYAGAGAPQMTFIAAENVWVQADFTENNLGNIDAGDEVEMVFDILPGNVFKGVVREVGFGVAVDNAPLGSLPSITNDSSWLRSSQRYPVLIDLSPADASIVAKLKVGSQVTVVVYTGSNFLFNPLAALRIRLNSVLTYAY